MTSGLKVASYTKGIYSNVVITGQELKESECLSTGNFLYPPGEVFLFPLMCRSKFLQLLKVPA